MVKIEGKRKVHIIKMVGEPQYNGREGYALYIDDLGQIHGTWGDLSLRPERDRFEVTIESLEQKLKARAAGLKKAARKKLWKKSTGKKKATNCMQ